MDSETVYLLNVYYPNKEEPEKIFGIIDYEKKLIKAIDLNEKYKSGFKEKGLINLNYVKKIDIIESVGCLSSPDEECEV